MNRIRVTPENSHQYIGRQIRYISRNIEKIATIRSVTATGKCLRIDNQDLENRLQIVSRKVFVV